MFFQVHPENWGNFPPILTLPIFFQWGWWNHHQRRVATRFVAWWRWVTSLFQSLGFVIWIWRAKFCPGTFWGGWFWGLVCFVCFFWVDFGEGKRDILGTNSSHPARLRHPKKESSSFSNHPFSGVSTRCFMRILRIFSQMPPLKIRLFLRDYQQPLSFVKGPY